MRLYRILPALALIALILDQVIAPAHHELRHALVGFATGLLFVLCFVGLNVKSITLKGNQRSSDSSSYPLS